MASQSSDASTEARQRNTERFGFRTTPRIKQAIEQAAALSGQDMSTFALSAAYERAMETIRAHEVTRLMPEDHEVFLEAIENPPAPTEKLRDAFTHHRQTVAKR
ncbi:MULTISPECIES: DUF1778 domain-containing protein [unclassified Halomonas]|uniref:type II toxin-antitoxin system TacA family antitoxin n=1 Tax=unclassified Halomonas TaxID=2609666 RepID=UPI0005FA25B4|nr:MULTISPECIES: DUF1778 domain-containing protein [unclassified Halomonas]KJZ06609.1 hypothetical protein TW86_18870 [Halomonas sp. S2151]MCO7215364.1 DUF1778 domain-containing protein [Halomonas sp. OfavH-34-E]RQW72778.1 DUF1778 domain-containing protein [Halomonas sp. YLB-10]